MEAVVKVRAIRSGAGHRSLYINIPKEIAEKTGITAGDYVVVELSGDTIRVKKLAIGGGRNE